MKKEIWKFKINQHGRTLINTHAGAEILAIGIQDDEIVTWIKFDSEMPKSQIILATIFTGSSFHDDDLRYIDTVQLGAIVSHIFEVIR